MLQGRVFDIKRYSVHDGPGIRTTVFLQGCPLACAWCHNPESQPDLAPAAFRPERCLACGACASACPNPAKPSPGDPWPAGCLRCGSCTAACPSEARQLATRLLTPGEVLARLEADRLFFEESGGGASFSGGEPLAQPEFLAACLSGCRDRDLSTVVDTSGHGPPELIREVSPLVDLWLFDHKHHDPERHRALTGVDNATILDNLKWLGAAGANVWVRLPVIPGYNDTAADVEAAGRQLVALPGIRRVHLLPYHAAAVAKRARFGLDGPPPDLAPPSRAHLEDLARRLVALGLDVHLGG